MKNNDLYILGQQLRKYRQAKGLSQEKLAEILDISHITVGRIENGNQSVNILLFMKILKILEVDANDVFPPKYISDDEICCWEMKDQFLLIAGMNNRQKQLILKTMSTLVEELIKLEGKNK